MSNIIIMNKTVNWGKNVQFSSCTLYTSTTRLTCSKLKERKLKISKQLLWWLRQTTNFTTRLEQPALQT